MSGPTAQRYAFGEFRVDAMTRELRRDDGSPIALTPRVFDTLLYFVEHAGVVVSKDDVLAAVWPGRVVEENNLNQNVSTLRRALGESTSDRRYILTEPGRGYRFVADVHVVAFDVDDAKTQTGAMSAPVPATPPPRFPSGLARAVAVLAVALAIACTVWWLAARRDRLHEAETVTTVAVLPFRPLLADERDEVLELGMADTLIAKLSESRRLVVRSLNAVRRYDTPDLDPLSAGRELSVNAVLEGQLQRQGDRVRLVARLLSVPSGRSLWSGTFDDTFTNVFAVQDSITEKVAAALALKLDPAERARVDAHATQNADAYRAYLTGRYLLGNATPSDMRKGIEYFKRAIELDHAYALAYAGLGDAYRRLPVNSDVAPKDAFPLAKDAATNALKLDDSLGEAHAVLGWVALWYDWDWSLAENEFKRAIELNPNAVDSRIGYMELLSNLGRAKEAKAQATVVTDLDPLSPLARTLAAAVTADVDFEEGTRQLDNALEIYPHFWIAHLTRAAFFMRGGRYADAVAECRLARDESEGSLQAISVLGYALAKSGDRAAAEQLLETLQERSGQGYVPPTAIATVYAGLGESDAAMKWLQDAYDVRDVRIASLKTDHRWDDLRSDPRFVALARELRLN